MPRKPKEPIYEVRNCPICNESFTVDLSVKKDSLKKTCGKPSCAGKYGRLHSKEIRVNCKICNTEFTIPLTSKQRDGNYCSDDCKKQRFELTCIICLNPFKADRKEINYCSLECIKKANESKIVETICYCCGKAFTRPSYTLPKNKRHFCSKRCNQRQFAKENPNKYGSKWARIRERKVEKDNYTCNRCGVQKFGKYELNVHHIIPIELFQNIEDANCDENLETLCYECHMKHHDREILSD